MKMSELQKSAKYKKVMSKANKLLLIDEEGRIHLDVENIDDETSARMKHMNNQLFRMLNAVEKEPNE